MLAGMASRPPPVGYIKLYREASKWHRIVLCVSAVMAIASGAAVPLLTVRSFLFVSPLFLRPKFASQLCLFAPSLFSLFPYNEHVDRPFLRLRQF